MLVVVTIIGVRINVEFVPYVVLHYLPKFVSIKKRIVHSCLTAPSVPFRSRPTTGCSMTILLLPFYICLENIKHIHKF